MTTTSTPSQRKLSVLHPLAAAAALACLLPGAAWSQAAGASDAAEIVVTGSRIRGVPPVGSPVQAVSRDDIESAGALNTAQILQQVPQIFNLGVSENSRGQPGGAGNITYGSAINLRGIGPFATLVLVNGHRVVGQGTAAAAVDPSIIPALLLERVEVVADGASAIYGSDAVAGVANLILRRNEPGAQAMVRFGQGDGYNEHQAGVLYGRRWSGGQFTLAAEHTWRSALSGTERDYFRADQRAAGGGDARVTLCSPGNIVIAGVNYAIPAGGVTAANRAQLVAGTTNRCDNIFIQDLIPKQERNTLAFTFNHDISKDLTLFADGLATQREYRFRPAALTSNLTVPQTNPFYVRPIGAPAGTSEVVAYSFINQLPVNTAHGNSRTANLTLGADLNLAAGWKASGLYSFGKNNDQSVTLGGLNNPNIAAALAQTDPARALNPFGSAPNSPAVLANLANIISISPGVTDFHNLVAKADGPLMQLPGGALRAAVGVEMQKYLTVGGQTGGTLAAPAFAEVELKRRVNSTYAELLVPVVGKANAMSGVQRLDLTLAARTDRYSDVGNTSNPKLGVTWAPAESLALRGSYGESFRAPGLTQIRGFTNGGRGGLFGQNYTDPTLPAGSPPRLGVALSAGNPDLKPETAVTKTLGLDWELPLPMKTKFSLTWFDIVYDNQVTNYLSDLTILGREAQFAGTGIIVRNPSAELIAQMLATYPLGNANVPSAATGWTLFVDGRNKNLSKSVTRGVDFSLQSRLPGTPLGDFVVGVSGTVFNKYQVNLTPASPVIDQLNTIFNPLKFKARTTVQWTRGPWQANLAWNHVGAYDNNLVTPIQRVRAHDTLDLRVALSLSDMSRMSLLKDATLVLAASNLSDRKPPYVNLAPGSNGGGGFDPAAASPLGRVVTIGLDKRF
jgi:iron complex outermembrane recepter protein